MEPVELAVLAAGVFAFALVSRRAERGILTAPLVFTALGLAVAASGAGLTGLARDAPVFDLLGQLTLLLVLFTDASRVDLTKLGREHALPIRLLGVGLPLTIAAGTAAALWLLPELGLAGAALLAAILAPTDAALGQAVVNDRRAPLRVRQALNVESGLNDGLVFPAILVFLSLAGGAEARAPSDWALFVAAQIGLGPLVGVAIGVGGAKAIGVMARAHWMNRIFLQISVVSLAVLAYAGAETVSGNGFIAAFAAGLAVGTQARDLLREPLESFAEVEGQLLSLVVFLLFGAAMIPAALATIDAADLAYAALSLTLVRMIPVAVAMVGTRIAPATVAYLGWFGPRGLASILYLVLVLDADGAGVGSDLYDTVIATVTASIVLHGITASPGVALYARRMTGLRHRLGERPEHRPVFPFPTRLPRSRNPDGAEHVVPR